MFDVKQVGEALVASIKAHVSAAVVSITKRLDELEVRLSSIPVGKSAYDIAVARGFVGTEPEWIASLCGKSIKGDTGKDADLAAIKKAIDEGIAAAVAGIPVAKDGQSVSVEDVAPMIAEQVKAAIADLPAPVNGKDADPIEIARLIGEAVAALPVAADGKSVTVADVAPLIAAEVQRAVGEMPQPVDGKDASPEQITVAVSAAVAALPAAKDGASVTIADVAPLIAEEVQRAVAALPAAAAGSPGEPGKSVGIDEVVPELLPAVLAMAEKAIAALPKPKDGTSVSAEDFRQLFEAEQAKWALDFERRAADVLQRAVDRMPKAADGAPGRDAFDLDDIELRQSADGRTITLGFRRGDEVREKSFVLDHPIYRGVHREGEEYVKGDTVTWAGSSWIAEAKPSGKPGDADSGWRLAVKAGRAGRDLRPDAPVTREPVRLK